MLQWPLHEQWDLYCKVRRWWISLRMCWGIPRKILWRKRYFNFCFQMLLVSLASDFLVSIENHNSEGKERKINKGRRRTEKAIGHFLKNSRVGGGGGVRFLREGSAPRSSPLPFIYHLWQKRCSFRIPFTDKWYPFHIPSSFNAMFLKCE